MLVASEYSSQNDATLFNGDRLDFLQTLSDGVAQLIVTSPPYNIGKRYESRLRLEQYKAEQAATIKEAVRTLAPGGSICWQVGNHIAGPQEIIPLDIELYPLFASHGLTLRNRIVWHFEHGLHC